MSVIYNALGLIVSSVLFGTVPLAVWAQEPHVLDIEGEAVCNFSGECSMDVGSEGKNILAACEAPRASISWNRKEKGVFLIACDCKCTSHDNTGWLIGGASVTGEREIQRLYLGKEFTVEALGKDPSSIFDIMASHPLCEKVDVVKLRESVFVTLLKQPTNNQSAPYCFLPAYIMNYRGSMKIKTNDVGSQFGKLLRVEDLDSISRSELLEFVDGIWISK
ncbi:hypothetical protein HBO15_05925 [Pseudomonas sp. WS 5111]|jgi:hypothetical protein|uniref:hypothetical protein n=1 Tax=unclassified Pseudomonas TaxID=196821 RepID=UPI0014740F18|nr:MULTISPECIES: hypothetical protein [unclassified Pseudomonas]NMX66883.1 hypothetical protein [Pseudomonas sp. WS 5111]NMX84947.1 hypothetical protein [Pseudomonas sp. WS 5010]